MKSLAAAAMLLTACTTAGAEEISARGTGKVCNAAKAGALVGRNRSEALGAKAMRLSGAGAMRWIRPDSMVTMDYREDRLNIHLDARNRVTKLACG